MVKKKKKKKKKKTNDRYIAKQKRTKKFKIELGLSDEALFKLGYRHKFGKLQKVLFVMSIFLLFMPYWFLLEKRRYAQKAVPALIAFFLHGAVLALILWLIFK